MEQTNSTEESVKMNLNAITNVPSVEEQKTTYVSKDNSVQELEIKKDGFIEWGNLLGKSSVKCENKQMKAVVPLSCSLPAVLLRLYATKSSPSTVSITSSVSETTCEENTSDGKAGTNDLTKKPNNICEGSTITQVVEAKRSDLEKSTGNKSSILLGNGETRVEPLGLNNKNFEDFYYHNRMQHTPNYGNYNQKSLTEESLNKFDNNKHSRMENIFPHEMSVSPRATFLSNFSTEKNHFQCTKNHTTNYNYVNEKTFTSHAEEENDIDILDPSLIPDDNICAQITEAVEFYFSNDIILKDAFLLKHVRRNKEGFVSLKLVSSFKRVRQLVKDWRVVGAALRKKSKKMELNDIGTKVRRIEPLPNFDETMPSRTIVVCDLPLKKLNIDNVSDIFSKHGEIAFIRILKPGMNIPMDVRQFMNKYPEMQEKECALIEYVESASARAAKLSKGPYQVFEMVPPKKKTGRKALNTPVAQIVENYRCFNDIPYERSRGGSFSGTTPHNEDFCFKLKRNNSEFLTKVLPETSKCQGHYNTFKQQHEPVLLPSNNCSNKHLMHCQNSNYYSHNPDVYDDLPNYLTKKKSIGNLVFTANNNESHIQGSNSVRRMSNSSDNFSGYSGMSRRSSYASDYAPQRRNSNCSELCFCTKKMFELKSNDVCKSSPNSFENRGINEESYVNGSVRNQNEINNSNCNYKSSELNFERKRSLEDRRNPNTPIYDDEVGGESSGYVYFPRRNSNSFANINNKLSYFDNAQYINGRRISTDSGYDRRSSFGSECEGSPRQRTGSFLSNKYFSDHECPTRMRTNSFLDNSPRSRSGSLAQKYVENLVRNPIGPDGSKGFCNRTRKIGQAL